MVNTFFRNLPLTLIIIAIALLPSFVPFGVPGITRMELRVEDFLLVLFGGFWLLKRFIKGKNYVFALPPLFWPIVTWLSIVFLSTLANLALGNVEPARSFFFVLKEIEFFFLFYFVFYHTKNISSAKYLMVLWIFLALANVSWVVIQFALGIKVGGSVAYGPGAIPEPAGPLPSGGMFLLFFIYLFNLFLYHYLPRATSWWKKLILGLACTSPMIGVFASGSRTSVLALFLTLICTMILYLMKHAKPMRALMVVSIAVLILGGGFLYLVNPSHSVRKYHINPLAIAQSLPENRGFVWKQQIDAFLQYNPLYTFLGLGRSIYLTTEESHSQYVRNFIETGVIGSLAFLFLMFSILKVSFLAFAKRLDPFVIAMSAGFFVSTIAMLFSGIATEIFFSVKIDEVYWSLGGIALAIIVLHKKSPEHN